MAEQQTDNKAIGTTFLISGIGVAVSMGLTLGWLFAPAGAALVIVGLVYLTKVEDAS